MEPQTAKATPAAAGAAHRSYQPTVGPRLRIVLVAVFAATALLATTGVYLLAIRLLEMVRDQTYTNQFTLWMFIAHVLVGVAVAVPFLAFGLTHWRGARRRTNRRAIRLGLALFAAGCLTLVSGLALIQLAGMPQLPTGTLGRGTVYLLHSIAPVAAVALYVFHRWAGPRIRWQWARAWAAGVAVFVLAMALLHLQDPRKWYAKGPREGEAYFEPSKARTAGGNFIHASALQMDDYCIRCHRDVFDDWFHSAHHFSSFNNPPYRFSVRETRKVGIERDGHPRASRWCAGCHDPVPFFSGAFDDPNFDDVNHPTSQAGITCTVCHAITHVNSTAGNADYTIEEPLHYPFAYSGNPLLQWVNNQVVKAKPDFHKKTFLKPFHRTAEFCSTCHKVSLPGELNHYKEFLRGQNHYDSFLLSGVSGHGARSFYYPPAAKENCAACHMPLKPSADFGSRDFDGSGVRKAHNHLFPAANNGLPWLVSLDPLQAEHADRLRAAAGQHADFLRGTDPDGSDRKMRIDIFGIKRGGTIEGTLLGPLRPQLPALKPGAGYLIEVVLRTLNVGHHFTQGTADSNEVWVDFAARAGNQLLGRSGALAQPEDRGPLDEWAHRVNVLMLDRHGQRINRRNPQDIFTPLYDHQIPPGAAQVVHYRLDVPRDVKGPIELTARLRYRKFDFEYLSLVYGGDDKVPALPVVDLCADRVVLPVEGGPAVSAQESPVKPAWQRWNDYGIGCLLEGGPGLKRGELRQAEEAFRALLETDAPDAKAHAHINLARVFVEEGRLSEAVDALKDARDANSSTLWLIAWLNGLVNVENARDAEDFDAAIKDFERILDPENQPRDKGFDFTKDYVVINRLAATLFKRAQVEDDPARRESFLLRAVTNYERTLTLDGEDLDAHYGLYQCYRLLAQESGVRGQGSGVGGQESGVRSQGSKDVGHDEASLLRLAGTLQVGRETITARLAAAEELKKGLDALRRESVASDRPKRATLEMLLPLRKAFHAEKDPGVRGALAQVLHRVHLELHEVFRPDDNARSRAASIYRRKHPAADHAAEAIVIYQLKNRQTSP